MGLIATIALAAALATAGGERPRFSALVFSATAGYRHEGCIDDGRRALADLGRRHRFAVTATEDPEMFTGRRLRRYDAVVFLCTTGDVLDGAQQAAFERYIRRGGGYAGIHSAADTEYDWSFYGGLVGAYFRHHPEIQAATMTVEDRRSPATRHLGRTWRRAEEWYSFRDNPRREVHVLLSVDEGTYDPGPGMGDHPIAWCHRYRGGRSVYTALGHAGAFWSEPRLRRHVLGGLELAAGARRFRCQPPT